MCVARKTSSDPALASPPHWRSCLIQCCWCTVRNKKMKNKTLTVILYYRYETDFCLLLLYETYNLNVILVHYISHLFTTTAIECS